VALCSALEAIETVSVTTSTFDIVGTVGRHGGERAHERHEPVQGSAFEYHYDEHMKSRPYFLPSDQKKPQPPRINAAERWAGPSPGTKRSSSAAIKAARFEHLTAVRHGAVAAITRAIFRRRRIRFTIR
jgi:hypothetical protein